MICIDFRLYQLLKDFCGVVNETSLKANIILVYEVLEEVLVRLEFVADTDVFEMCGHLQFLLCTLQLNFFATGRRAGATVQHGAAQAVHSE